MKPERILFVCHGHPDLVPGGTEIVAHDLFRAIRDDGHAETMFLGCVSRLHRAARPWVGFQTVGRSRDELLLWIGQFDRFMLGHIDTVPIADNVPSRLDDDGILWGCGTCDMKSGVAVQLRIAATVPAPNRDLTFVFYDNEEVAAHLNGLRHVAEAHPDWLAGDFAVLLEPSDGQVEGGCQGTIHYSTKCQNSL